MDEKIAKLFLPLLDKLYNTEPAGEPFRKPVDVVKYGCYDYYAYVKHPIDLSTIRDRLTSHQYKDAWRFVADIQLMFSNAYLFNKKGTPVWEFTNKLNKIWNSELSPIMQRLNYCCGTLHKFGPQLLFCHGTTPDRYCQIAIGAKYKCYEDQYSFCMPCFNKIDSEYVNIQNLSCETSRMILPTQPVKKSDFLDCANDNWQYESFVECSNCNRRVHQICELYPAREDEIDDCIQHSQLEQEQKELCQVPEQFRIIEVNRDESASQVNRIEANNQQETSNLKLSLNSHSNTTLSEINCKLEPGLEPIPTAATSTTTQTSRLDEFPSTKTNKDGNACNSLLPEAASLDDELLQFARDIDDYATSPPNSPTCDENRLTTAQDLDCHKDLAFGSPTSSNLQRNRTTILNQTCITQTLSAISSLSGPVSTTTTSGPSVSQSSSSSTISTSNSKASVDSIAARLSINKLTTDTNNIDEANSEPIKDKNDIIALDRDRFVCNHCYRKKKIGFNLRHRKYSARRLPHTRMSKYIETKVNEFIRDNSPSAGEVTIRVLTSYRDTNPVKPEMKNYIKKCRDSNSTQHPHLKNYPDQFSYTNRAIFAWQEIEGVDVCVFGMHVQEYGEDCPEPNRQVIYLSYLDSVHFFRPKSVRTAVYHEIILSYFKYVRKLGFRRIFIWVCPSRKGDDYIFYRHPSEQKMPTLKRLADWYVNLLDKGIVGGIVESHQNIFQFAQSQTSKSLLSMPYLSGDYWPGEFERVLKIMIESQKDYEAKLLQQGISIKDVEAARSANSNNLAMTETDRFRLNFNSNHNNHSGAYLSKVSTPPINGHRDLPGGFVGLSQAASGLVGAGAYDRELGFIANEDSKSFGPYTPESQRSDLEQPLDLSKSSSTTTPESTFMDDDQMSECSYHNNSSNKSKRRKTQNLGYTKKRKPSNSHSNQWTKNDGNKVLAYDQTSRSGRQRVSDAGRRDSCQAEPLIHPEDEMVRELERSLKRQRDGFIVARLNDLDSSPYFELQRRKEENHYPCEMMKGREPFLQLARLKNYEFSTLRRAKFSSLAMVKHLGQHFKLDPICNECFSFDSSKCHLVCKQCEDFYLCTSCHDHTQHKHPMTAYRATYQPLPSPLSHITSQLSTTNLPVELDQVLIENFIRHAEVSHDIDFDQMKDESKKLLTHYGNCSSKEDCPKCKFVVLSCSFMSVLMLAITRH